MTIEMIDFKDLGDDRGGLLAIESLKNAPFEIKRVYFIYRTVAGFRRGMHAHKKLKQIVVPISGHCKFLLDNGVKRTEITLDNPLKGLLLEGLIWREMFDFSPDCVLAVLASDHYDESDYIRDYGEFLRAVNG